MSSTAKRVVEPLSYPINDSCQVVGIGRSKLYELVRDGKLKMVKVGRRSLITADSLRELVGAE